MKRRDVCKKCLKAAVLCICKMFPEECRVENRVRISILQHPDEKDHHLGSARIAQLGLRNVELILVPEIESDVSYRLRPKVPGSLCSKAGSAYHDCYFYGCVTMDPQLSRSTPSWLDVSPKAALSFPSERALDLQALFPGIIFGPRSGADDLGHAANGVPFTQEKGGVVCGNHQNGHLDAVVDLNPENEQVQWSGNGTAPLDLQNGAGDDGANDGARLDHGYEENGASSDHEEGAKFIPEQLIVLDGTWSKAKRLYMENPWLMNLPHYKLPENFRSMYSSASVRSEPKPGCMSTLEGIVYALKAFEPQTRGLDYLLDSFESMMMQQHDYMLEMKKKKNSNNG